MDLLTLQQLAGMSGGILEGDASVEVSRVTTDSRFAQSGDLFVALRGERFDGHAFLPEVVSKGVRAALVDGACREMPAGLSVIRVPETLIGLQNLAAGYRKTLPARIVGITGSSGKTTTKDFTFSVLSQRMKGWCTSGNLNNHIGVPLTLLAGDREFEMGVVEMGMNHSGEIAPLAAMARPEVGIITNIGVAHIEFLGSQHAIALEKGALAAAVGASGTVVLPASDPFSPVIEEMTEALILRAGLSCGDIQAVDVQPLENGSRFALVYEGMRAEVELAVPGLHMVQNAALAAAAGIALGVPLEAAAEGLRGMKLTKGRMESRLVRGIHFLDDTYNANPDSMCAALRTLAHWPANGARIAVLGRMGELGAFAEEGHRQVGKVAADGIDWIVAVGEQADWIADEARRNGAPRVDYFGEIEEASAVLRNGIETGDVVLVKGSRSARMERVIEEVCAS
jgi:UDP-N-acetylmuramoyl-tripeptide--D-alanyl-D-alanine ligase